MPVTGIPRPLSLRRQQPVTNMAGIGLVLSDQKRSITGSAS